MIRYKSNKRKMKLVTLSPVHIGSGEFLSPYSEYIYQNGFLHYIDQMKLSDDLYRREDADQVIDQFVDLVKNNAASNQEKYKLIDFVNDHGLDLETYTSNKVIVNTALNSEQVQRMITTANRPYIPGSSIKGALRTSILYSHLVKRGYKFDKMKGSKLYIGEDVFGRYGNDILKNLHVSDTNPQSPNHINVLKTIQWDLLKCSPSVPIVREVIPADTEFEVSIQSKGSSKANNTSRDFTFLIEGNEEEIFSKVNAFYLDTLEEELKVLSSNSKREFEHVISFYKGLREEVRKLQTTKNGAIFRIGAGKTFIENTIFMVLNADEQQQVKKNLKGGNSKLFPKTRTVIMERDEIVGVLGWIKIEFVEGEKND